MIKTPYADEVLGMFTLKCSGVNFNTSATEGQKVIMEAILGRTAPDGSGKKRVHILAHTRFGKSMAMGAAIAIRASMKGEKWAIVAPTKDQAQIIMDYVVEFAVNDPIISQLLRDDVAKAIKKERLTQRRARDHVTFLKGGEVRTYAASGTMGFGAANVVLDEAGLIDNEYESKVFRMLGDHPDNFYVKIGNPWTSIDTNGEMHHFQDSYIDEAFFSVNYDWRDGLRMGRLTESYLNEVRRKPFFDILYENLYPDADVADKLNYLPLFTHKMIKKAVIEPGLMEFAGDVRLGGDPADGGENESVIALRGMNKAKIAFTSTTTDVLAFADEIARHGREAGLWSVDKQGVGAGTVRKLEKNIATRQRLQPINAGEPVPDYIEDESAYSNLRAFMFWKAADWIKGGGRLEGTMEDWKQLLAVRQKTNTQGKIKIISKDELHKRRVHDLGRADALSFTFAPKPKRMTPGAKPTGGVAPYYPTAPDARGPAGNEVAGPATPAPMAPRSKRNAPYYPRTSF